MSEPELSICIRAWRRDTLPAAIASVLGQGLEDLEVLVSDDRGDLGDVALAFGDPRVRYHRNSSRLGGPAHIRSVMQLARGRYLGLLDDDDYYLPGFLDAVLAPLRADPQVGVAFTNHFFDERDKRVLRACAVAPGRHDRFLLTLLREAPVPLSATVIRREVWEDGEQRRPLSDDAPGDAVMWIRAAEAEWPFYYVDRPLMGYRVHPEQMSADETVMRDRGVQLWSMFSFDDPECENLRRARLASALGSRAAYYLKNGNAAQARLDISAARQLGTIPLGCRDWWVGALAARPRMARAAVRYWHTAQGARRR